eukprot:GHVN01028740.1.p1 GENE.GHVN01028740.1~~GHVN01028740.1.p1  ORF type:complete len:120 (-),score=10.04 GHVN01028740.1:625-984(-)
MQNGIVLNTDQVYEDINVPYRGKTVTPEDFPYKREGRKEKLLEVHPCNHGRFMRQVVEGWHANNWNPEEQPRVHLALILFVQMLSNIMPTMTFRNTVPINISGLLRVDPERDDVLHLDE